jgi:hypothetical protein
MSKSFVTPAIGFVDLATFSDLEAYLYGGSNAVTYFVRSIKKSNWFSFLPVTLRHVSGVPGFGNDFSASVNRSGDYVLNSWLRVQVPQIQLPVTGADGSALYLDSSIRWTRNFMHNLIQKVNISFNELVVNEFDNHWLDFNHYLRTRGSKQVGYRNMIGDISSMTTPVGPGVPLGTGGFFNLVLPFWYGEDSGIALQAAALPFNDIKINYFLRDWTELLVLQAGTAAAGGVRAATTSDVYMTGKSLQTVPKLTVVETWSHYAIVHNDERVKMGKAPRDVVIHQVQELQEVAFDATVSGVQQSYDLRLSHAVHLMVWAARNNATTGEWSNYTTEPNYAGLDPISNSALVYENTFRMNMGSDYFSLVAPYLYSDAIPEETGIHFMTYAIHPWCLDPSGSTGMSKLANVSIVHDPSPAATNASSASAPVDKDGVAIVTQAGAVFPQKYRHVFRARNWNIVRASGGSLGLPVL